MCKGDVFPFVQNFEVLVISRGQVGEGAREGSGTRELLRHRPELRTHQEQVHSYMKGMPPLFSPIHLPIHLQHNKTCPEPLSIPTPPRSTYPHNTDTMPLVVPGITSNGSGDKTEEWMNKLVGKKISESEPSNETVRLPNPRGCPGWLLTRDGRHFARQTCPRPRGSSSQARS